MENLRVLEGSEVFFRGLQHLYHQFKSGWRLLESFRNDPEAFLMLERKYLLAFLQVIKFRKHKRSILRVDALRQIRYNYAWICIKVRQYIRKEI